uniref:CTF/NF-I domain-containing protein n=1 Tax=Rhabditophanes sp. KR3021 TaxID=114890 RepID=A0AC35U430_9BILA
MNESTPTAVLPPVKRNTRYRQGIVTENPCTSELYDELADYQPFVRHLLPFVKEFGYVWFHLQAYKRKVIKNGGTTTFSQIQDVREEINCTHKNDKQAWAIYLLNKIRKDLKETDGDILVSNFKTNDHTKCIISNPDNKNKIRRIDCMRQADKIWRLDIVMMILFKAVPLESTDGDKIEKFTHCKDHEFCVNPFHMSLAARELDVYMSVRLITENNKAPDNCDQSDTFIHIPPQSGFIAVGSEVHSSSGFMVTNFNKMSQFTIENAPILINTLDNTKREEIRKQLSSSTCNQIDVKKIEERNSRRKLVEADVPSTSNSNVEGDKLTNAEINIENNITKPIVPSRTTLSPPKVLIAMPTRPIINPRANMPVITFKLKNKNDNFVDCLLGRPTVSHNKHIHYCTNRTASTSERAMDIDNLIDNASRISPPRPESVAAKPSGSMELNPKIQENSKLIKDFSKNNFNNSAAGCDKIVAGTLVIKSMQKVKPFPILPSIPIIGTKRRRLPSTQNMVAKINGS